MIGRSGILDAAFSAKTNVGWISWGCERYKFFCPQNVNLQAKLLRNVQSKSHVRIWAETAKYCHRFLTVGFVSIHIYREVTVGIAFLRSIPERKTPIFKNLRNNSRMNHFSDSNVFVWTIFQTIWLQRKSFLRIVYTITSYSASHKVRFYSN